MFPQVPGPPCAVWFTVPDVQHTVLSVPPGTWPALRCLIYCTWCSTYRSVCSPRYLARLALSDLLYLIFNIPFCLKDFALTTDGLFVSEASAVYYAYLAVPIVNFFLTMSVYIIVWLSYDRWMAVCSPHKFPAQQRLQIVHKRYLATIIVTFIVYVPSPLRQTYECVRIREVDMLEDREFCCVFEPGYTNESWYYYIYEFCREVYSRFLPGVLITAFNVAIIITLQMIKIKKNKLQLQREASLTCKENKLPLTNAADSVDKNLAYIGDHEVCSRIDDLTMKCCHISSDIQTSLEKYELRKLRYDIPKTLASKESDGESSQAAAISEDRSARLPTKILIFPERSSSSVNNGSTGNGSRQGSKNRYILGNESRNDREMCLVILLLAITLSFYISSFPSALYKIMPSNKENDGETSYDVFRTVADVLEVSGHVFNFCLYFLLSPEFRRTLLTKLPFLNPLQSSSNSLWDIRVVIV